MLKHAHEQTSAYLDNFTDYFQESAKNNQEMTQNF